MSRGERWFRSLAQNSSDVVMILEADGTVRYVSPAVERVLGYRPEDFVGTLAFDYVHPEDIEHMSKSFAETLQKPGLHPPVEYRVRAADGSWRHVEAIRSNWLDDPHMVGVVANVRDVSERKRAEEALKESEERYRTVVEQSVEAIYLFDAETKRVLESNAAFRRLMGFSEKELLGMSIYDFIDHDHEDIDRHIRRSLKEKRRHIGERRYRRKDGSVIVVDTSASVISYGGRTALCAVSRDVTERRKIEDAVRKSEARLAEAQRLAHLGGWEWDIQTDEISWSDEVYRIYGLAPQSSVPSYEGFIEVVHPDDRNLVRTTIDKALSGSEPYDVEHRVVRPDGEVRVVHRRAEVIRGEGGEPLRMIGTVHDITDSKRAEEALRESEERYRTVVEEQTELVCRFLPDLTLTFVNAAYCRYFGEGAEELVGSSFLKHIPEEDRVHYEGGSFWLSEENPARTVEHRVLTPDAGVRWQQWTIRAIFDAEGHILEYQSVGRDVTERRKAEDALKRSEARLAESQRIAHLGTWEWDVVTGEVWWSEETNRIHGFDPGEEINLLEKIEEALFPEDLPRYRRKIDEALSGEAEYYDHEHRIRRPDGEVRWVHGQAEVVRDEGGEPLRMIGTVHDVTERKALEDRLRHQAFHDALTGLPNRQLFLDRLGHTLARMARRRDRRVAVLFMDLDNFKVVNDSLGHETGDSLLVFIAYRLKKCLRSEDTLARFGGDEFTVLLEDVEGPDEPIRVAERIIEELRDPFVLDGREVYARASIGITIGEDHTTDADDLLRKADTAMYRAKDEGSGYALFDPTMYEKAIGRLEAENDLRRAVEQEEFVVHYQPVVSLKTGDEVLAVEALVRWKHPQQGLLNPDEFVPLAEESGLVVPMGEQVLRGACFKAKEWQEEYPRTPPLVLFVNLSARQLARPDLADTVEGILEETGLDGSCLTLDVTETVYVRALAGSTETLDRLRNLEARISIDDFGVGYSSLAYLKRLPADALKIDRSFVKGLGEDVEDTAIVHMIIELAHTLGLEVIAEGVENEEQAELAREMGCDMAQGYHFAKPLPPDEIPALLSSYTPS